MHLPGRSLKLGLCAFAVALLVSCSSKAPVLHMPSLAGNYEDYVAQTTDFVSQNRKFSSSDITTELKYNSPYEVKPSRPNGRGILLIHGLGDSPWTFRDIADRLANEGYLVRVILLPGHGTKPQDMIGIESQSWRKLVADQMALLKKDVDQVWIGGFSTGGNLAYEYASKDENVRGVVLFSPAIELRSPLIKLAPLVDKFVTWLISPDKASSGVLPFRYTTVPMDAIVSFKDTMDGADEVLSKNKYDKPSIVMFTEHDSIVNTKSLVERFDKQLTSPESLIIWYGELPNQKFSKKVLQKPDYIPEEHIQSFAHMSLTYSPENEWYGKQGKYRFCRNSLSEKDYEKCMNDKDIWYGAWGSKHGNKVSARLTFNPYFDWQMQKILDTLEAGALKPDSHGIIEIIEPIEKLSK